MQNAQVILFEDDPITTKYARKALVEGGHQVVFHASDLSTGKQLLSDLTEPADVALVDSTMPKDDKDEFDLDGEAGLTIAGLIKDRFPTTTIVFFSSRKEQTFGHSRFPTQEEIEGEKGPAILNGKLEPFISSLPAHARK